MSDVYATGTYLRLSTSRAWRSFIAILSPHGPQHDPSGCAWVAPGASICRNLQADDLEIRGIVMPPGGDSQTAYRVFESPRGPNYDEFLVAEPQTSSPASTQGSCRCPPDWTTSADRSADQRVPRAAHTPRPPWVQLNNPSDLRQR